MEVLQWDMVNLNENILSVRKERQMLDFQLVISLGILFSRKTKPDIYRPCHVVWFSLKATIKSF
jgi:CRISPR/Cas system CMR-associated protein Cmr1 (group 7 of RAMP superfamily)